MTCFDGRQYHRRGVSMALLCSQSKDNCSGKNNRSKIVTWKRGKLCIRQSNCDVNSSYSSEDLRRVVMMMTTSKATKRQ